MTEAQETFVDPEAAAKSVVKLTHAADDMKTKADQAIAAIRDLHNLAPWGTDAAGEQFNENYLQGEKIATTVLDNSTSVIQSVAELGPSVRQALTGVVEEDAVNGERFPKTSGAA